MSDSLRLAAPSEARAAIQPPADFVRRHVGPSDADVALMLKALGLDSLDALVAPDGARRRSASAAGSSCRPRCRSPQALEELAALAAKNRVLRSYLGMGYHDTLTPAVIQRNVLENPGWYTQYTPYQAEISQGRLEALLNFQTMVADLTGLPLANASLLDEATAAAEAMTLCRAVAGRPGDDGFFVAADCHPQTIAVVRTKAAPARHRGARRPRRVDRLRGAEALRRAGAVPGDRRRVRDYAPLARARPRGGRAGRRRRRPARAHAAAAAGRVRRRRRRRLGAALRRADGLRRTARGVLRGTRGAQAPHAGPAHRRVERRRGPAGAPPRAADPRAAHPAREGDEQHLHRAGAARDHGVDVRGLPRARGPEGDRRRVHALARVLQLGLRRLGLDAGTGPFFDTLRVRTTNEKGARDRRARSREGHQPARLRRRLGRRRARRDRAAARRGGPARGLRRVRRSGSPRSSSPASSSSSCPLRTRGRARSSRTPSSTPTTPRPRCCATSTGWRRATSRSRSR